MSQTFKDKTVIITGASAGVGAACARTFAAAGANLVLTARGREALEAVAAQLAAHTDVLAVAMDVSDDAACLALLQSASERFGRIDVLVNNAGTHERGDVSSIAPKDLARMIDVNLRAPLYLTGAALPELRKARGAIVMVGSLAGRTPMQGAATYAASKAGLRSFTFSLADELAGDGVHVGVVSPGPIDTGFIMDEIDEVEDIVFSQPMSSAQQVADAVMAIAQGQAIEICLPAMSGRMTTLSYLFPSLRRRARARLYAMGRKNKAQYRARQQAEKPKA